MLKRHIRRRRTLTTLLAITVALGFLATRMSSSSSLSPSLSTAPQATREPGMMFDPTDRLAPPPMSDPPTQVEQGRYAFYLSCMVCHGDQGQGLTEEWRGALDPTDQNCWQSKCHAANHPPDGFQLPRYAPPVIGDGRLAHHQTAAGLHEYLRSRMPWQAPGILSDEAYWQLTAFLVDANGIPLDRITLGSENAANVHLTAQVSDASRQSPAAWLLPTAAGIFLLLGGLALLRRTRAR